MAAWHHPAPVCRRQQAQPLAAAAIAPPRAIQQAENRKPDLVLPAGRPAAVIVLLLARVGWDGSTAAAAIAGLSKLALPRHLRESNGRPPPRKATTPCVGEAHKQKMIIPALPV